MSEIKRSLRFDEKLYGDIENIAKEKNASVTFVIDQALKLYRDKIYMDDKATIINQEIINIFEAISNIAEKNINNKTNSYLSELAIQTCVQNMILARSLEINSDELCSYRKSAIEFLKERQRLLRLDEII